MQILLEPDVLPHRHQILPPDPAVLGVVLKQVGQLGSLLHQMDLRQADDLLREAADAQHLAQREAGIVEAQRLVEVAGQQILLHDLLHGSHRKKATAGPSEDEPAVTNYQ